MLEVKSVYAARVNISSLPGKFYMAYRLYLTGELDLF